jgi:tetrahydromethanopterin S-methyltransferase subunit G
MSEEQTERFEGSTPFEIRVLRELSNINQRLNGLEGRLTSLEEKVDARLHDTRPIWESVLSRLDSIEARLDSMDARLDSVDARVKKVDTKFDVVASELLDLRTDVRALEKRPPAA